MAIPSLTSLIVSETTVLYAVLANYAPTCYHPNDLIRSVFPDPALPRIPCAMNAHPTTGTLLLANLPRAPSLLLYFATAARPPTMAVVFAAEPYSRGERPGGWSRVLRGDRLLRSLSPECRLLCLRCFCRRLQQPWCPCALECRIGATFSF